MGLWQLTNEGGKSSFISLEVSDASAQPIITGTQRQLFWEPTADGAHLSGDLDPLVEDGVSAKARAVLLWPFLAPAVFSLLLWRWTDDLRLYGWCISSLPCTADTVRAFAARNSGAPYWLIAAEFS